MTLGVRSARVVGTGSIGSRYLRVLSSSLPQRPIAVPIRGRILDPALAEVVEVEPVGAPDRPSVDLTIVATRTSRHLADAAAYGEATTYMLIEKPIASRLDLVLGAATPAGDGVQVACPLRFTDGFSYVSEQVALAGTITGVDCECRSWLPDWRPGTDFTESYSADADEGGVLLDLIHEVDYCQTLFGVPDGVSALLSSHASLGIGSESIAHLIWRYPDFSLSMTLDYVSRSAARSLRVRGTARSIYWNLLEARVDVEDHTSGEAYSRSFGADLDRDRLIRAQISDLTSGGTTRRGSSVAEALTALALCDIARESSRREGATVMTTGIPQVW